MSYWSGIMAPFFVLLFQILIKDCGAVSGDQLRVHYPLFGISELASESNSQKSPCRSQIKNIYYGIKKREIWALRLLDSSGDPKSGFVWGNNYWLGTYSQCRWVSSKQSILPSKAITKKPEFPPFNVDFYVASFRHNSSYQAQVNVPQEDLILIGLCLPSVCDIADLKPLLASWSAHGMLDVQYLYNFTMVFHNVRAIKQGAGSDYLLVIALSSIIGLVVALIASGTLYDIYMWRPKQEKLELESHKQMNNFGCDKIRNICESDELINRDNNLNDCYESKADNSLHKSIPAGVSLVIDDNSTPGRKRKKFWQSFLICFSSASNARAFVHTNYDKDNVPAIHGLRFLAMIWIICLYTLYYLKDFADNKPLLLRISQGFSEQLISNSTFSVDTFFFTSGFLLSYIYNRNRRGSLGVNDSCSIKSKVNEFSSMFLYRFIRLTPVYLFVLLIANLSIKRNSRMSLFEVTELSQNVCEKYWWRNLLYINNLFRADEMCMSWSWYLSTEMQFFTLGSFLLILSTRYWKFSAGLIGSLTVFSSVINGYLSYKYSFAPTLDQQLAYLSVLHYPPWTRIGPYLIGIATGYFAIFSKGKLLCNKATLITCWIVGCICNFWALFGLYNKDMSIISTAVYVALSRPAWALGLSWIVIACITQNAGILNSVLSFRGWIPLSKLSFTAYLLSPLIINLTYSSSETPIHLDFFPVVIYFFGFVGITYSSACILSLALELPFNQIGKCLTSRKNLLNQLN